VLRDKQLTASASKLQCRLYFSLLAEK